MRESTMRGLVAWIVICISVIIFLELKRGNDRKQRYEDSKRAYKASLYTPSFPIAADAVAERATYFHRSIPKLGDRLQVGNQAIVAEGEWANLINFNREELITEFGGIITIIEIGEEILTVEYTAPGTPGGTSCYMGAQFQVTEQYFRSITKDYVVLRDEIQNRQQMVDSLSFRPTRAEKYEVTKFDWVEVVNNKPIPYAGGHLFRMEGDDCSIDTGGIVQALGDLKNGKTLYKYTTSYPLPGTASCNSGILFVSGEISSQSI